MKTASAMLLGVLVLSPPALQSMQPVVRLVEPTEETLLTGPSELMAEVLPAGLPVQEAVFFVDGVQVCRATAMPLRCAWDAGARLSPRTVRVAVVLQDGRRLTHSMRTKGVTVSEVTAVDAVLVPVHVTDDHGRFARGLALNDFRLLEDDVPQEITSFLAEDAPVSVMLALDISGSMAPAVAELKAAAGGFLGSLRPQDSVTLAGFNNGLFILSPREADPAARIRSLDRIRPWGGTSLYDAAIRAVDLIKAQPAPRAVVIFTDGDDVSSRASPDSLRLALEASDVVLYWVAQGKASSDRVLRDELEALAVGTGGAAYFGSRMSALQEHFSAVVGDLSHQYLLGYSPRRPFGDGKWRRLSVQLTDKKKAKSLVVRTRQGYTATRRSGGEK